MITVKQSERINLIRDAVIEPFFSSLEGKYSAFPPKNQAERTKLVNRIVSDLVQEISSFQTDQPLEFSKGAFTRRATHWIDTQWPLVEEPSFMSRLFKCLPFSSR